MTTKTNGTDPEVRTLAESVQQAARGLTVNSSGKKSSSELSKAGPRSTPEAFARAIAHLCAMKRTADLTELQMETWYGVLQGFSTRTLNRGMLELVLSDQRFPDLGDFYQTCRRIATASGEIVIGYSPWADTDTSRPGKAEIQAIAERLGLEV